ncbi:MAG: sodium:solute symporter [Phycisphaeraceae bacterium]|nr:sodium:solute symporter [Phycisphaeraceae bacterium]
MSTILAMRFDWKDWGVLALYFVLLAVTGYVFGRRKQHDVRDYFLGGRSMPAWAVAISVLATSLSAATFIGGPQQAYDGDLTYLSANIGAVLASLLIALYFIPRYYRHDVATVYELMEIRFGPLARRATSIAFMIGRVLASGARLYMAALAAALIFVSGRVEPQHIIAGVVVLAVIGVIYTLAGGIRSVIWTDVVQTIVFVFAALVSLLILFNRLSDAGDIATTLDSKLTVFRLGLDFDEPGLGFSLSDRYTLITALIGFTIFNLAAYGTDQDLAQRMLTCRSAARGSASMISAILMGLPVTALFMGVGLLLYLFYRLPGMEAPERSEQVFLQFILNEMPHGVGGLMMAGLFAAALSSFNSALNAMASSFVNDVYRPMRSRQSERHYLVVGRIAVVGCGVLLCYTAIICIILQTYRKQTLIDFALSIMIFAYSGLLAAFLTALFTRRGSEMSITIGLIVGFIAAFLCDPLIWATWLSGFGDATAWLAEAEISFPWRMVFATLIAFVVCCLGRSPAAVEGPGSPGKAETGDQGA